MHIKNQHGHTENQPILYLEQPGFKKMLDRNEKSFEDVRFKKRMDQYL